MSRGYPDYNVPSSGISGVSFDVSELAARLGSLSRIDRLGHVIYMEDFENGLSPWTITAGVNMTITVQPTIVYDGIVSLKMAVTLAGGFAGGISKAIPLHTVSKVGLEYTIGYPPSASYGVGLTQTLTGYTLDKVTRYITKLWPNPASVSIYGHVSGGSDNYIALPLGSGQLNPNYGLYTFHHIKMVYDIDTGKYVRMYLDENSFNLSSYYGNNLSLTGYTGLLLQFSVPSGSSVDALYLDNLIVTIDEP